MFSKNSFKSEIYYREQKQQKSFEYYNKYILTSVSFSAKGQVSIGLMVK